MNQLDINEQLKLRFARPLGDFDARRVVVWHDPDGEFEEDFDKLAAEGFDGAGVADGVMPAGGGFPRNLRFLKAEEGVMFLAKKLIARDDVAEEDVYNFCAGVFDNIDAITAVHAKGGELNLDFATSVTSVPYHPGAAKYFAEQGITVPTK